MTPTKKNIQFCRDQAERLSICYPIGFVNGMSESDFDRLNADRDQYFELISKALILAARDEIQADLVVRMWLYHYHIRPTPLQIIELGNRLNTNVGTGDDARDDSIRVVQQWVMEIAEMDRRNDYIVGLIHPGEPV